jgi:hypothetical protein
MVATGLERDSGSIFAITDRQVFLSERLIYFQLRIILETQIEPLAKMGKQPVAVFDLLLFCFEILRTVKSFALATQQSNKSGKWVENDE